MSADQSVTFWLDQLRDGDRDAAQPLWERYFAQLVRLARGRLRDNVRRAADEEDVALSAFDSFCRGVEKGHFPHLADRHNLWALLVRITACKAADLAKKQRELGESDLPCPTGNFEDGGGMDRIADEGPTPEFAAEVAEEYRQRLDMLEDDTLRRVAVWKMEGYTSEEIAATLGCVVRTVERKLRAIRNIWREDALS